VYRRDNREFSYRRSPVRGQDLAAQAVTEHSCRGKVWHLSSSVSKWKQLRRKLRPGPYVNFLQSKQLLRGFWRTFTWHHMHNRKLWNKIFVSYWMQTNYESIKLLFVYWDVERSWNHPPPPQSGAGATLDLITFSSMKHLLHSHQLPPPPLFSGLVYLEYAWVRLLRAMWL
jgi:hypothetical protein